MVSVKEVFGESNVLVAETVNSYTFEPGLYLLYATTVARISASVGYSSSAYLAIGSNSVRIWEMHNQIISDLPDKQCAVTICGIGMVRFESDTSGKMQLYMNTGNSSEYVKINFNHYSAVEFIAIKI